MAKKPRSSYICQQCGYVSPSFLGKCPECETWGSLVETIEDSQQSKPSSRVRNLPKTINLQDVEKQQYQRLMTGLGEFDQVLGGGIVAGSVVLVSGDPGIGKSTLLTQLALNVPNALYIAGEESPQQIKLRADRIKNKASLLTLSDTNVDVICEVIRQTKPGLVIIDSIQTLETEDLSSAAGAVGQVRECAHRLVNVAKTHHIPIFLVGHVTKEGTIAGPKTLEHMVDAVLNLEGDPNSQYRILRTSKNRFGPTDEVGIFEMSESGMKEVANPSQIFLDQKVNAPGSAVVVTINGLRPLLIEIQALVTKSYIPVPRRVGNGVDNNRLQLLVAVLTKRLKLSLFDQDIFVNVTGGIKVTEPAVDLGICMAIISSFKDQSIAPNTVFAGEVGLLGELRNIRDINKRKKEAEKLGFTNLVSSDSVKSLTEAMRKGLS